MMLLLPQSKNEHGKDERRGTVKYKEMYQLADRQKQQGGQLYGGTVGSQLKIHNEDCLE